MVYEGTSVDSICNYYEHILLITFSKSLLKKNAQHSSDTRHQAPDSRFRVGFEAFNDG